MKPVAHEFITTFDSLRQDVFLEMAHFEQMEGTKWIMTILETQVMMQ